MTRAPSHPIRRVGSLSTAGFVDGFARAKLPFLLLTASSCLQKIAVSLKLLVVESNCWKTDE